MDNAGGHNVSESLEKKLTHVSLEWFDPNTTSKLQPCDQGIIRSFKAWYRWLLTRWIIKKVETSANKDKLDMPDMKEAIELVKEAWDKVTSKTIVNCWIHAGIFIVLFNSIG